MTVTVFTLYVAHPLDGPCVVVCMVFPFHLALAAGSGC